MQTIDTDIAIIGSGTAGMGAYRAASQHTDRVLLIEGGPYGTTCARVGCMPSKLLIAAGDAAEAIRHAPVFGVQSDGMRIDGRAVMQRVRSERDRFVGFVVDTVEQWPEAQRMRGSARFIDRHTLRIDDHTEVRAARIVIATGTRPKRPADWARALGPRLLVNDDVFDWQDLPESVGVVGAGVIGVELAQALHALGVRVRLFGRGARLLHFSDPEVSAAARALMQQRLDYEEDAQQLQPRLHGDRVRIDWRDSHGDRHDEFDFLLCAIGREPNLDTLDIDAAGLPRDADGKLQIDRDTCQIGDTPVFIAGDVHALSPLLHEAADDGRIAGDNAGRWPDLRAHPRRAKLSIAFSDPQAAIVGERHADLLASGRDIASGEVDWCDQGRARVIARNAGLLRVYGDRASGCFLGAEMIGPQAEHIAHLLAWSLQQGLTVERMLEMPFYHPVLEEGLRTALRDLLGALRMGPTPPARNMDCGPGA
ncbi:MAG TPA: dihydrolipoyl dehydrogenase [Arenimonas sp.]|nr:dihydrolipoyl dehydrogenase [Arenimonas sp.]